MKASIFEWFQVWLEKNCNGVWEQEDNFSIFTIDNPGWGAIINLEGTKLENKPFSKVTIDRTENDWVYASIVDKRFQAGCGQINLIEMLKIFIDWFEDGVNTIKMHSPILSWLQDWAINNCNGDWEHSKNFSIKTIHNPGWKISINLEDTFNLDDVLLEEKAFKNYEIKRGKMDWLNCYVEKRKFQGTCGAKNLAETLQIFIDWAESQKV